MIVYLTTRDQLVVHAGYLASWGRPLAPSVRLMSYDELFRRRRLPVATWVFADLERLAVADRERVAQVWATLERALPGCRLLNHPLRVHRRYSLLRALHEAGINDFDVFRVDEPRRPSRYPVFLRREDEHEGVVSALLSSAEEVDQEVEALVRRGTASDDLLVVEAVIQPDGRGRHWKYSAFRIGDRMIPGHLFVSDDWVVRAPEVVDADIIDAELGYLESFPHEGKVRQAFEVAQIDFGRIDYALTATGIRVFEINTHPTVMGPQDNFADERRTARIRSAQLITEGMRELDRGPSGRSVAAPRLTHGA